MRQGAELMRFIYVKDKSEAVVLMQTNLGQSKLKKWGAQINCGCVTKMNLLL